MYKEFHDIEELYAEVEGVSKLIHPLFYSSFTLCTT